jgi:hypothetical protein
MAGHTSPKIASDYRGIRNLFPEDGFALLHTDRQQIPSATPAGVSSTLQIAPSPASFASPSCNAACVALCLVQKGSAPRKLCHATIPESSLLWRGPCNPSGRRS